jgi:hypothetical protein
MAQENERREILGQVGYLTTLPVAQKVGKLINIEI